MINIEKLAKLSKFRLTDEEKAKYTAELTEFVKGLDGIVKADTPKVEAAYNKVMDISELRKDEIIAPMERKKLLANAPEQEYGAYLVPGVIE